jgi:hypothetical protein
MRRRILAVAAATACLSACVRVETREAGACRILTYHTGYCCSGDSHSQLRGEGGRVLIEHLGSRAEDPAGRWLLAAARAGKDALGNEPKLFVVDLRTGRLQAALELPGEPTFGLFKDWTRGERFLIHCRASAGDSLHLAAWAESGISLTQVHAEAGRRLAVPWSPWSPDGSSLAVLSAPPEPGEHEVALVRVSLAGGAAEIVDRVRTMPNGVLVSRAVQWEDGRPRLERP